MAEPLPPFDPDLQASRTVETEFIDLILGPRSVAEIEVRPSRIVRVITSDGRIVVFKKRALSQLLKMAGVKGGVKAIKSSTIDSIREAIIKLLSDKEVKVRALVMSDGALYAVRATSPDYVAVPHRMLFDYVSEIVGKQPDRIIKYSSRTAAVWFVKRLPLDYAREGDAISVGIAVSNANTGQHSIKVYGFIEILKCRNGLITRELSRSIRIVHRLSIVDVLRRVGEAVKETVERLGKITERYRLDIEELQRIKVHEDLLDSFIEKTLERLRAPKRLRRMARRVLEENVAVFGPTALAAFQTLTYLVTRCRSEDLAQRLSKAAIEIIERRGVEV